MKLPCKADVSKWRMSYRKIVVVVTKIGEENTCHPVDKQAS